MPPSAVLVTLAHLWPRLESSGVPVAVAGGIALSYWGNPRSTQDVDVAIYSKRIHSVQTILIDSGFTKRDVPAKDLGLFKLNQFEFDPRDQFVTVEVDLMVSDSEYYRNLMGRLVQVQIAGLSMPIDVLSREDLILHKLYSNRLIDQADVQQLMQLHQQDVDRAYLQRWAESLAIGEQLRQAFEPKS